MSLLQLFIFLSAAVFPGNDAVVGEWLTGDQKGKVQIYECSGKLCGKIVWLNETPPEYGNPAKDINNPNENLRNRTLMGMNILEGFEKKDENFWEGGTIYDPKNGKTYKCNMTLEGSTLKVRGYIGFSLLGRTEVWTKAE